MLFHASLYIIGALLNKNIALLIVQILVQYLYPRSITALLPLNSKYCTAVQYTMDSDICSPLDLCQVIVALNFGKYHTIL